MALAARTGLVALGLGSTMAPGRSLVVDNIVVVVVGMDCVVYSSRKPF